MTEQLPPLRNRLLAAARAWNVPIDVVELDYGQSYVLAALFGREDLRDSLVFKGGTALHKVYFSDYRFSADLDFTTVAGLRGQHLEQEMRDAAAEVEHMLDKHGPFEVNITRRAERGPHPAGQEAFLVQVTFPWHRSPQRSIKLEVTVDEPLSLPVESRPMLHDYDESLAVLLPSYCLEEIVAEKLRTPLQAQKMQVGLTGGQSPRSCRLSVLFATSAMRAQTTSFLCRLWKKPSASGRRVWETWSDRCRYSTGWCTIFVRPLAD